MGCLPLKAPPPHILALSWANLASVDALTKLVPAVLSTLAMIMTMEHFNHPLALSGVLTAIVLAFHAGRLLLGWSLEDAMDKGWVLRPAVSLWGGGVTVRNLPIMHVG